MRALLAVALAGCSQWFGLDHPELVDSAAPLIDAPPLCLGEGGFRICVPTPSEPLTVPATIDTLACPGVLYTEASERPLCVLAGTRIALDKDVVARNGHPLVLFASEEIIVTATLDVASHAGQVLGAGGEMNACPALGDGTQNGLGGGGGAGGSFGTAGGSGGAGTSGSVPGASAAQALVLPETLRGGCGGSLGGVGAGAPASPPGYGGGAVLLIAGSRIAISGTINASGAGGGGGNTRSGGSGGGSGGMIALHAPMVSSMGTLIANGGGGGGGADNGAAGLPGEDPASPDQPARGGLGGGMSGCGAGPGCGGTGAAKSGDGGAGQADATNAGGGGGGGGLGVIRVLTGQTLDGRTSPAPSPSPP